MKDRVRNHNMHLKEQLFYLGIFNERKKEDDFSGQGTINDQVKRKYPGSTRKIYGWIKYLNTYYIHTINIIVNTFFK